MKKRKWKLVSMCVIVAMFSTFAGFEFYPQIEAAEGSKEIKSGAAFILDEVPEIPQNKKVE